ncbi:hypothetical protein OAP56_00420 [Rickettsiaceae bacterium]|nr:hypothetical protein [Rickettsiaceae bacterium]
MVSRFLLLFVCILISGCANKMTLPGDYDIQLTPKDSEVKEVKDIKITYLVPRSLPNLQGINGLMFYSKQWGVDSKQEKIIPRFGDTGWQIERRVDNGTAGSGIIYIGNIIKEQKGTDNVVIFEAKSSSTYQEGLVLPFPIPRFDIKNYLESAKLDYNFELVSEFPSDAMKANLHRGALYRRAIDKYEFNLSNASVLADIKVYPYRNASKIVIKAQLSTMKSQNNLINVSANIAELEKRVRDIIND